MVFARFSLVPVVAFRLSPYRFINNGNCPPYRNSPVWWVGELGMSMCWALFGGSLGIVGCSCRMGCIPPVISSRFFGLQLLFYPSVRCSVVSNPWWRRCWGLRVMYFCILLYRRAVVFRTPHYRFDRCGIRVVKRDFPLAGPNRGYSWVCLISFPEFFGYCLRAERFALFTHSFSRCHISLSSAVASHHFRFGWVCPCLPYQGPCILLT